jgi:acid phosphatase
MLSTLVLVVLIGCPKPAPVESPQPVSEAPAPPPARDDVLAVAWVQTSAEADAVARTVYQAARASLDVALDDPTWTAALEQTGDLSGLSPAIVVDVDETVLDNSPYQARGVLDDTYFAKDTWGAWVGEAKAPAIPGAADFLMEAKERGIDVFYVSNRSVDQEEPTRQNLAAEGFPDTDDLEHFLFRPAEGDRSKTTRRKTIEATHRIVLLFGDNLFDFVEPESPDRTARAALVEEHADWWGTRWFMLPNPMYGSWDDVLHGYEHPDAPTKAQQRKDALDPAR